MLSLLLCLAASSSVHAILHAQNTSVEPEAGQANKFSQYLKCHKVKKKSNTKNAETMTKTEMHTQANSMSGMKLLLMQQGLMVSC